MKSFFISVAFLLSFLLAACSHSLHKNPAQAPPAITAPPVEPAPSTAPATGTNGPGSTQTNPASAQATTTPATEPQNPSTKNAPPPKPKTWVKHPPSRAQSATANQPTTAQDTSTATLEARNQSPAISVIGNLTSGNDADLNQTTLNLINSIERDLKAIKRNFNSSERETAAKIRDYLTQAKAALASGDADGAYTLAAKAKLLLGELNK